MFVKAGLAWITTLKRWFSVRYKFWHCNFQIRCPYFLTDCQISVDDFGLCLDTFFLRDSLKCSNGLVSVDCLGQSRIEMFSGNMLEDEFFLTVFANDTCHLFSSVDRLWCRHASLVHLGHYMTRFQTWTLSRFFTVICVQKLGKHSLFDF